MTIASLNNKNRNCMKGTIGDTPQMAWNDETLIDTLMGQVPKIKTTNYDNKVKDDISELRGLLVKYRYGETQSEEFLKKATEIIRRIKDSEPRWYGFSIEKLSYFVDMQKFCLISGYGGMGKSYFIYRFEGLLQEASFPHLCIYGKFQKTLDDIDFAEIKTAAYAGSFLFIIDAINEMDTTLQQDLICELKKLNNCPYLRVIITYRTYKLKDEVLQQFQSMATYQYEFGGVSFESALDIIIRLPSLSAYKYEGILYTNNAFYLKMLCKVLADSSFTEKELNSFSSITHILEAYIKSSISKAHWENTKKLAKWMYDHRMRAIPQSEVFALIDQAESFITAMKQYGLIDEWIESNEAHYFFIIESLTDYLLARYFLQEIKEKSIDDQLKIIKQRRSDFFGMDEAFIVALFDLINDYERIKKLLIGSGLDEAFSIEMLSRINFREEQIAAFQSTFPISEQAHPLLQLGGYSNKPYNCVNYLNNYYFNSPERQQKELSEILSGRSIIGHLTERLKNMIYFITVSVSSSAITEEMLWFSFWCTASSNQMTRCYAIKLLYEVLRSKPEYIGIIISPWNRVSDYYIQEAIIQVLSLLVDTTGHDIKGFLSSLMNDPSFHLARSLKRISVGLGDPYRYILSDKKDLFHYQEGAAISKKLNNLFWQLYILEKHLIPFDYWSKDQINWHVRFLDVPKQDVYLWNSELESKFSCAKNGQCNGSMVFENRIKAAYPPPFTISVLDSNSFLACFERCLEKTMEEYGINVYEQKNYDELAFLHSVFRKVVDIAVDRYYGSMMSNYYSDSFTSYNNARNSIGYDVYDPIEYDDEEIHLTSPVPTFVSTVETLGDVALSKIDLHIPHDEAWSRDAELSIANIQSLLQSIKYKKDEWVLLNANVEINGRGYHEFYGIHCCTDSSRHLSGKHRDRYLTIELSDYHGAIDRYKCCTEDPRLCKHIPSISGRRDWFDDTNLVFPPSQIVAYYDLHYSVPTMSWNTANGKIVIRCDNNKQANQKRKIKGAVYMLKEYFDDFSNKTPIHFFCYTEKMIEHMGYTDEASLHLEYNNGTLINSFNNADEQSIVEDMDNPVCQFCPHGF